MSSAPDKTMIFNGTPEAEEPAEDVIRCADCGGECVPAPERPQFLVCKQCGKLRKALPKVIKPGTKVGKYRVLNNLAEGGMGSLYLCHPLNDMSKRCVLKVMKDSRHKSEAAKRFERESQLLFRMNHENIVKIYDYWYDADGEYIVMEYISGMNLEQLVERGYTIEPVQALQLMQVVANALRYAWIELKLLHRDIKPSNIMITDEGFVKLLDFGIAKSLSTQETTALTLEGQGLGSPGFMSLEQLRNTETPDCTSDIYSLGATIYYVVTKKKPYEGDTPMEIFDKMVRENPVPVQQLCPEIPPEMADLITRTLAKDPQKRPRSWGRLMVEIERILKTVPGGEE